MTLLKAFEEKDYHAPVLVPEAGDADAAVEVDTLWCISIQGRAILTRGRAEGRFHVRISEYS